MSSRPRLAIYVALTILVLAAPLILLAGQAATAPAASQPAVTRAAEHFISPLKAAILGVVEGITEYLPVSSTGHLILASHFLGLDADETAKEAVDAFEVIIQIGAVLAVVGLYRRRVGQMLNGVLGKDPAGVRLILLLIVAFLPAAVVGLLANKWIKAHLFSIWPVVAALAVGGVLMIVVEKWRKLTPSRHVTTVETMPFRTALLIGCAQCLAMWPGTSRSMITIVAAILVGMELQSAAEFSFLLALPTLSAAALHDAVKHHHALAQSAGPASMAVGLAVSCVVAVLAVKGFVAYLNRRGLEPFGYYRIVLAVVLAIAINSAYQ